MTEQKMTDTKMPEILRQLEALLIVAEEPVSVTRLATALDEPVARVKEALALLQADYDGVTNESENKTVKRGFELREIAGGYRFYARAEMAELINDFVHAETPTRLSNAALETLTVIAYKQPISRGQVAAVRAVNVDSVVRTLVNRGLVIESGRDEVTGATLYGTSDLLLELLGLQSIDQLPPIAPLLEDGSDGFNAIEGLTSEEF